MAFLAHRLINNDPVPSGCTHRDTAKTTTPIDGGDVVTCDACGTVLTVNEYVVDDDAG